MLNRTLRDENRAKLAPFHQYLNLFMSAFKKLPSIEDRVWRGESGDWGNQYQPGTRTFKMSLMKLLYCYFRNAILNLTLIYLDF